MLSVHFIDIIKKENISEEIQNENMYITKPISL